MSEQTVLQHDTVGIQLLPGSVDLEFQFDV